MKRITIFTALSFVLIFTGFMYLNSGKEIHNTTPQNYSPPAPQNNRFYFGAMDSWGDERYNGNYNNYDAIGFNTWHTYLRDEYQLPDRKTPLTYLLPGIHDGLFNDVSTYAGALSNKIDQLNTHNNTTVLWMRPKIEWLLYGQSSTYQCEFTGLDTNYWFYAFNSNSTQNLHTGEDFRDNSVYGGGVMVKRCLVSADEAGWVVDRLRANTEQCNRGPHWSQDSKCDWYLKPRIRIDSTVADNPSNFNTPVCSLKVIDKDGNVKTTKILKVINFIDENLNYDGRYIEEFYNLAINDSLKFNGDLGDRWVFDARGYTTGEEEPLLGNHADIQVYWYGHFNMWIDYVKVENDIANDLFTPTSANYNTYNNWIRDEVNLISNASTTQAVFKYYMELFEFNNIPAMAYVNHKLDSLSFGKTGLMADFTNYMFNHLHYGWGGGVDNQHLLSYSPQYVYNNIVNKIGLNHFFFETYPLTSSYAHNVSGPLQTWSRVPNTLPRSTGDSILAWHVPPEEYELWLQYHLDTGYDIPGVFTRTIYGGTNGPNCTSSSGEDAGAYRYYMKLASALSKDYGVPFINMPQGHQWFWPTEVRREPTNEEMDMLANIAVSYGSKGLIYFYYPTEQFTPGPCVRYGVGMEEQNHTLRKHNVYHQAKYKWEVVRDIGLRMNSWKQKLLSFDDAQTKSYIYRLERNELISQSYFRDLYTYKPGIANINCVEDFPEEMVPPPGNVGECKQDRYLQVATFENPSERNSNYFMIVNRRCSPFINDQNDDNNGGRRLIIAQFNQYNSQLNGANNWKIINVKDNSVVQEFDKTQYHAVNFGWFQPGEGRLYKMVPVLNSGGTLAGDEIISGESFTCEAPVYNNGHNITIGANTTIHFNDSSKFVMTGGVLTVGDQNTSAPQNITSDAVTGSSWSGHSFTNCEVKIYGATFTGLANDTTYAVNIIDCPVVDIRNCTFNTNSSLKGGINAVIYSDPNNEISLSNIYIGANTFNSSGSTIPTVNISSYAGETTPLIIENNTFNEGNTAIFLSGITGGAIKGNAITDNFIGINALTSSIDIKSNTISSTVDNAIGIFAAGGSELKMNNAGSKTLGGLNDLLNSGTAANNIVVDGSVFLLDGGQNIFNITDDQNSKHLYGYFPMFTAVSYDEKNNCFKLNSSPVDPPYNMVTSGFQGSQITFNFTPYLSGCEANDGGDGFAINLGDGIFDTIYNQGSGSGGSNKQIPLSRGVTAEGSRGVFIITTAKQRYDSISVLMRYRNYSQARTKCLDLINTYPDSIQSLNAVSKLFLSTVASDTSYNAVNELKTYYENLIQNNSGNVSLVKRANYYILKCKVRMREYSQALAGFQQIINENPYSYEGLIARWDYMATSLLIQGQGGAYSSTDLETESSIDIVNALQREANDDDRSPFTKEQRQDIRKSINTAIEIAKNDDDRKIKTLEIKSEQGDVNASKELTQMLTLKQVIKTDRPKSITEHVRIVSEDIRKVFGSNTSSKGNEPKNIPLVFRLSQNYPNPFNPVTKINYDLPKESKVNIVIYDILGREIKRLKTAGSYIVDFNASNYASGVYFYRIEAEEPNGNKFVDSKKMVLIK